MISELEFYSILDDVKLAPSAHNTQPCVWSYKKGIFEASANSNRFLPIADPENKDMLISLGASLEAMKLALNKRGYSLSDLNLNLSGPTYISFKVLKNKETQSSILEPFILKRYCHRFGFIKSNKTSNEKVQNHFNNDDHSKLLIDEKQMLELAKDHDQATYHFISKEKYLKELYQWCRFDKKSHKYFKDGLNLDSMGLNLFEQIGVKVVMRPKVFQILKKLSLAKTLTAEASKVATATGALFIIAPKDTNFIEQGQIFYRKWLELTALNMAASPLSTIVDHNDYKEKWNHKLMIPKDCVLINILKFGPEQLELQPQRCRLETKDIIGEFII